jgi:hypothetical protein
MAKVKPPPYEQRCILTMKVELAMAFGEGE